MGICSYSWQFSGLDCSSYLAILGDLFLLPSHSQGGIFPLCWPFSGWDCSSYLAFRRVRLFLLPGHAQVNDLFLLPGHSQVEDLFLLSGCSQGGDVFL